MSRNKSHDQIRATLLLAGAFTFAFLLGEMVHEFGHYVSHLAYANSNIGVYLNPFGSSHVVGVTSLPIKQMGVTSAAGPLANLFLGVIMTAILWRWKRAIQLPLLLWGPVAMIQEGVNFSLGLLTPGGDAQWISTLGISKAFLVLVGIALIMASLVVLSCLLTSIGIADLESRSQFFLTILLGMCSLMLVRFAHSAIAEPAYLMEKMAPLILSLLLALIVVLIQPLTVKVFSSDQDSAARTITWAPVFTALALGAGMFLFQIIYSLI